MINLSGYNLAIYNKGLARVTVTSRGKMSFPPHRGFSSAATKWNAMELLTEGNEEATEKDLKARYLKLAKTVHPDVKPGDEDAARKFVELAKAYEEILNAIKHGQGVASAGPRRRPTWAEMKDRYRRARVKYTESQDANRSTRGPSKEHDDEDWANRASWYYANLSAEMIDVDIRKEVQNMDMTAEANSGGPDWGGYWAMAEMMQADAEERDRQQELLEAEAAEKDAGGK